MEKLLIIFLLLFLSASCNLFGKTAAPAGIIKTVNGGADWQFANVYASSTSVSLASVSVSKMDFDPYNRETVFAGSYTDGLYKSTDSAAKWRKILSKISVYDFAVNPNDPKIIYAAGICVDHGCVLKTVNAGASWDSEVFHDGSAPVNAVRAIALSPSNPNQLVIGTASGSVIKSADAGLSWQLVKNFDDRVNRLLWQGGNIYVLFKTKGLFESAGFADNFVDITGSLTSSNTVANLYSSSAVSSFSQMHVDFTSPDLIYLTTNRGLYKTADGGKNWNLINLPVKPNQIDNHAVAIAKSSSNVVYTSVGSTVYKSSDGGGTWQTQSVNAGGFINYILIDPQLPQIAYGGVYAQ